MNRITHYVAPDVDLTEEEEDGYIADEKQFKRIERIELKRLQALQTKVTYKRQCMAFVPSRRCGVRKRAGK